MENFNHIEAQDLVKETDADTLMDIAVPLASDTPSASAIPASADVPPPTQIPQSTVRPRVVFCLPGREYSRFFLISWTRLLMTLFENGVDVVLSQNSSSMVHFARSQCLGGDNRKGKDQKPFQGQLPYHFLVWIDSDVVFNPEDILQLLKSPHPVTAGYYKMENSSSFAAVKTWDEEYFDQNGSFEFITEQTIKEYREATNQEYMPVDYSGLGFMCFKYGVLEKLEYPWFASPIVSIKDHIDICSEDVYMCRKLKEAGVPIMLDTSLRVGHIKSVPL